MSSEQEHPRHLELKLLTSHTPLRQMLAAYPREIE